MELEWKLFADLADIVGDRQVSVEVGSDATVGEALDALLHSYPELRERVTTDDGYLHGHINVLQNGEQLEGSTHETPVSATDELALLPPVSGG